MMERKKALAGAGAIALVAASAALAIAAAFGMVGFTDASSKTGRLSTVTHVETIPKATPKVETVVIDVPATDGAEPAAPAQRAPARTSDDASPAVAPVAPHGATLSTGAPNSLVEDVRTPEPTHTPEATEPHESDPQDD